MITRTQIADKLARKRVLSSCPKISLFIIRNIVLSRHLLYILVIRIYFVIFFFYENRAKWKNEKKLLGRLDIYIYIYSFFLIESLSRTDDRERMEIFLFEHGTRRKEDSENNNSHVITRKIEWRIIIENIYVIINRYIVVEIERKWEKRKKKKRAMLFGITFPYIFFIYLLKILEK